MELSDLEEIRNKAKKEYDLNFEEIKVEKTKSMHVINVINTPDKERYLSRCISKLQTLVMNLDDVIDAMKLLHYENNKMKS